MGFSAKQVQALRRNLDHRHVRTREANGRELSYIEGWYAITEANRIFGFDGWNRETLESKCVLARENRGTFLAIYVARVRITVHADGATIIREGHGTGEGRGVSPGEVHDIALKAADRRHQTGAGHVRKAVRFSALWERETHALSKIFSGSAQAVRPWSRHQIRAG
ncbi:MAG: Rad52/Rad22 family DNA repair protein [Pseudolabrys sp.]